MLHDTDMTKKGCISKFFVQKVKPRPGHVIYTGTIDAWQRIVKYEGARALWQGARFVKPSTQFGVTLLMYEVLQRLFYIDFAGT
jgi:solute carrier family 25 aspartate/glutamate transporter 12/13